MTPIQQIEAILKQLDISDQYAKDEKPKDDRLPLVWEIQNSHIREGLLKLQETLTVQATERVKRASKVAGIDTARQIVSILIGKTYLFNEEEERTHKVAIELDVLLSFLSRFRLPEPLYGPDNEKPVRQEFFLRSGRYAWCEILISFSPDLPLSCRKGGKAGP